MGVEKKSQFWIWVIILIMGTLLLVFTSGVLMPFVAGMAVAYFLDPVADKIEAVGLSRTVATMLITVIFFALAISSIILLFPLLQNQILGFFNKLPQLAENAENWLRPFKEIIWDCQTSDGIKVLSHDSKSIGGPLASWFAGLLRSILQGGLALFNALSLLLVTPVVCFYLLRDWD